ncbi:MAG: putative toxin-antitoxin system toxin component, PIN family [Trueperaceae bacterium]
MKVVFDTNVFVSALLTPGGVSEQLLLYWREGRFTLFSSVTQLSELRRVSRYPKLKECLRTAQIGSLVNLLKDDAMLLRPKEIPDVSSDPDDNLILVIALEAKVDFLVSLNMKDVVALRKLRGVKIVQPAQLLTQFDGEAKYKRKLK